MYKSPLSIYVVWHPSYNDGIKYAEAIYNAFCRDVNSPLARGLNIPVYFRYQSLTGTVPIEIDYSIAERNAIILLIDDEMFNDANWSTYIDSFLDKESEHENTRIFPIALSKYAFSLDERRLSKKQFINVLTKMNFEDRFDELRRRLLHDLCRFFFNKSKVSEAEEMNVEPPVKLFVSHAKCDGEKLAIEFRDYIQANTKLKTFFDVNDIADAEDFEKAIQRNLKNTAIVVFLTDKYSTREWCRIEVIVAKRNKSPLVVVNCIENGEKRSFPYLGNVPTIRYRSNSFEQIIELALFQCLNNLFVEESLIKDIVLHKLGSNYKVYSIENAPELFNYIDIKRISKDSDKKVLVLYPDPPLGLEEVRVLNDIDQDIEYITPSLMYKL